MEELFSSFGSTLAQIFLLVTGGALVVILEKMRQKASEWYAARMLHPIARSVLANRKVHALLVELRTRTEADRAHIFLFHNGQVFSNTNPLWRVSCTQESCRQGTSHEIESLQNILASTIWDGIAPLFGKDCDCGKGTKIIAISHMKNKAYIIDVHAINDSYYKRSIISRGIKKNVMVPILATKNEVVGFLALNYCAEEPDADRLDKIAQDATETAGSVHYALMEK
jgi:hypothetical protein